MSRLEPNALLALSTVLALTLVVVTTVVYGAPGGSLRNPVLAIAAVGGYVLLNPLFLKLIKASARRPLISPDAPASAIWAAIYPLLNLAAAAVPVFWPGRDYGLLVVIAAVWCGATIDGALAARRA